MRAEPGRTADLYLVDDDPGVRDALGLLFEQSGYRVSSFADGHGLLSALQHRPADVLLIDVELPGPSGLDVLRQVQARKFAGPW
jgi:two-component system, LuxR family, response regulator FixJ